MIKYLAIGSFDGIHLGHQALIDKADAIAVIERGKATITPGYHRAKFINKPTFFYYLEQIKHLKPKEFIAKLNQDFPNLEGIVVGYDFAFGKDRAGKAKLIKEILPKSIIVDEVKVDGISVHSRVVRDAIVNSNIELANTLLGRFYEIEGYQIRGLGLGSKELVPTINLKVLQYTLPQGVFAINAYIGSKKYKAVCFIGHRKSVDNSFSVEFNIIDEFEKSEILKPIRVEFVKFIRENRKFDSLSELKEQIKKDIEISSKILLTKDGT